MAIVAAAVFAARRAPVRREGSAAASAAQIGFLARRVEDALAVLADARLFVRSASEHLVWSTVSTKMQIWGGAHTTAHGTAHGIIGVK